MPCAYKQVLGIDCPFCGAQRSLILLLQGKIWESLMLFPALVPLALTPLFIGRRRILRWVLWFDLAVLLVSWIARLCLHLHG